MKSACLIPCYNESARLDISRYKTLISQYKEIDFYLLNDGSTDKTAERLVELSKGHDNVFVEDYKANKGKAEVRMTYNNNENEGDWLEERIADPFEKNAEDDLINSETIQDLYNLVALKGFLGFELHPISK